MKTRTKNVILAGLLVALALAGIVSFYASASPDGLNRVANDKSFDEGEKDHTFAEGPLAGYSTKGVDNERFSGGLAGVTGVALTFLIGGALALTLRRRNSGSPSGTRQPEATPGGSGAGT